MNQVAIVKLAARVTPADLAVAIKEGRARFCPNPERPLPALGCLGIDVIVDNQLAAEVADADVLKVQDWRLPVIEDIITYRRSLRMVILQKDPRPAQA